MRRPMLLGVVGWLAVACVQPAAQAPPPDPNWRHGETIVLLDDPRKVLVAERVERSSSGLRVRPDTLPAISNGTLRLTPRPGWTRTVDVYRHFRMEFAFRGAKDSSFTLYFRAWPTLDKDGAPPNAHAARLRTPSTDWYRAVLECRGQRADLSIDGIVVSTNATLQNSAGYIGVRADSGELEIRDVTLTPLSRDARVLPGTRPDDGDVEMPRVRREVKPRYTEAAMRQRIQGAVLLELLVDEDGGVADVALIESLDPAHGLDREAIAAARQWRFEPARKDGKPVPIIVTLELQFTLK